ncbi:Zona pellucida sperm-binding protein 4 [Nibea albiflora]|uniref:Zona pellucida sperm-binding protein 4 n=1 Tax=Nibea albiflora TaxID=240163 RepID=A0ACB7EIW9_NIBAL|nr:Zona pellucida sperm-binding protein 4 [Nibea albiflora]
MTLTMRLTFLLALYFLRVSSNDENLDDVCENETLSAKLGSSVLLPCIFSTNNQTNWVSWTHTAQMEYLGLVYLKPKGQINFADPRNGRIKVYPNQGSEGNYSISIDGLQSSDLGGYRCEHGHQCVEVELVTETGTNEKMLLLIVICVGVAALILLTVGGYCCVKCIRASAPPAEIGVVPDDQQSAKREAAVSPVGESPHIQRRMKVCGTDFLLVTFISLSLLLFRCEALAASKRFQATVHNTMNDYTPICHDGFMSVYISKLQFADLPFTIYVQEVNKNDYPLASRHSSCNKDGFNITIPQNATVPPLNLDAVWIPSNQSSCKPQKRSKDAVTFSFPFTDCGTQSMRADGVITYWVNIEVKQHPRRGFIFRDPPFHLTVRCSFALAKITQLGMTVQREKYPSTLKSEGLLRTEMRFAKDSNYRSFYSSRDPPAVTELGQPVYVEVFVPKHEDKDLKLLLEDCWATPTKNPHDPQRWNLLVKGCPFSGDSHRTVVLPVVSSKELKYPALHKRFVVKLFSFVKPPEFENLVYFHCDIEFCKGPDCSQSCSNERRKLRGITPRTGPRFLYSIVSGGPLLYVL